MKKIKKKVVMPKDMFEKAIAIAYQKGYEQAKKDTEEEKKNVRSERCFEFSNESGTMMFRANI